MEITIQPDAKGATPQMPLEPPAEIKSMTFSPPPEGLSNGDETVITTDKGVIVGEDKGTAKPVVETTTSAVVAQGSNEKGKTVDKDTSKTNETPSTTKKETKTSEPKSVLKPPTESGKTGGEPSAKDKEVPTGATKPAPITPPDSKKDDFDYTGFSPQEITNLKNMSRQSRDWVASQMKEKKQLESLKDSTYLQHEQAYTLSPEYNELSQSVRMAQMEGRHWEQQALRIKAGEKFQDIIGFDPKTGQPVLGPLKDSTDADELRVVNNYGLCAQEAQARQRKLVEYPQQFKGRVSQDLSAISEKQKELFAWVANPSLMDHSVEVEGMGDRKLKDIKSDFMSLIPPYMRSHPIADVAANMLVGLQIRNAELREARNSGGIQHIQDEEVRRSEPTSDNSPVTIKGDRKIPTTMAVPDGLLESMGLR